MTTQNNIPLSLYIHLPWCVKKCPYCDFNSHLGKLIPEKEYINTLITDLKIDLELSNNRKIETIFIGGGTPSLFSGDSIQELLDRINQLVSIDKTAEITLEANPGTIDIKNFIQYRQAGINRLSLGIQSFNAQHLKKLGRIHNADEALHAIEYARTAGFKNINLDLMFGLPEQSIDAGLQDLQHAILQKPEHISWYQLTLEPNTVFYKHPPSLPTEDYIAELHSLGQNLLAENNYQQYEISAYAKPNSQCKHNINYWQFGDYLGIGAGAHGKITCMHSKKILRRQKYKLPRAYMAKIFSDAQDIKIDQATCIFEFMLNALRLTQSLSFDLFSERTRLPIDVLIPYLQQAKSQNFITYNHKMLIVTAHGRRYLNNLLEIFLP
ncbi:MAG: YggW family oxidoreductase [Legionellales bacterium]|nr:YggW family oxidoreductase [Legionellales bacterium]